MVAGLALRHHGATGGRRGVREERQSSSGIIVANGTGATGWAHSIHAQRRTQISLPGPKDPRLAFFVREAFPSVATGTELTEGVVAGEQALDVASEMNDGGVLFGDGIEEDRVEFGWGMRVRFGVAVERLMLVR